MPRDYDLYENYHDDGYSDIEEEDRDASFYEAEWGGPEEEELYEEQDEEDSYRQGDFAAEDSEPALPPPQRGDEAGAKKHFAALKEKYKSTSFRETSPLNPLYKILLKLESREQLDNTDVAWLRQYRLRGPIRVFAIRTALDCEKRFRTTNDAWEAVKASSFWRMAENPSKALEVTAEVANKVADTKPKLKSAVLTTRGGAFRDQKQLDDAEACGLQAIQLNQKSFYPYMLLGAIYYQKGDPQKGDEYLAIAKQLGAKPTAQDREIRRAVSQAGQTEQRIVAQYLLKKDSDKYHWAKKYLR